MDGGVSGENERSFGLQSALKLHLPPGRYHRLMQVIGRINRSEGDDPLLNARDVATEWLKKKGWSLIPSQIKSDRPVHFEDENSTRALSIESAPGLWAVRLDDPCGQVAGRQWRVELVLVDMGENNLPAFGCTLSVLVPVGNADPISRPGIPAVVGLMARSQGFQEAGHSLNGTVWEIDRPAEVDNLLNFIESRSRTITIVVVSSPRYGHSFCDPSKLAMTLSGLAVVATVSADAAQEITHRYGRPFGVFGDAVRVFRIGFDPDVDDRFRHPLFVSNSWRYRTRSAVDAIASLSMADTVGRRDDQRDVPSFGVIRSIAADQRIKLAMSKQATEGVDSAQIAADISALMESAQSWEKYALEEDKRAQDAEDAQRQTLARLYVYSSQIRKLETELRGLRDEKLIEFDRPLDQISEWAEEHFVGRIVVTPRAARAVAASDHLDAELIYRCLYLLANHYWEMKVIGGADFQSKCKLAEAALGVRISPSGDAADMRQYEGEYRVRWEGRNYKLDMHLAGSDSRDRRRGLRIYFAWEDEQELLIIGHLPTHLTSIHT